MKKLILILLMSLTLSATHAQVKSSFNKCYNTSWYIYENGEWVLQNENKDVDITIVFYKNAINIQAKTPTLYKIKSGTKKTIDEKTIYGQTYETFECVNEYNATVSYIYFRDDDDIFMLSVLFKKDGNNVNFRYLCQLNKN